MKALDEAWQAQLENNTTELPISEQRKAKVFLEHNIVPKIG